MKLSICCITWKDTDFLEIMLEGQKDIASEFVIGLSKEDKETDNMLSKYIIDGYSIKKIFTEDLVPGENYSFGKAKQKVHEAATGDWIMWLDSDETLGDNCKPKLIEYLEDCDKKEIEGVYVQYIHFINDFAHIDNSEPIHYGISRIYKNKEGITHPAKNHALPVGLKNQTVNLGIIIFHLGYLRGMNKIRERFWRNHNGSEVHMPYQQIAWRDWHYYGKYPVKEFDIKKIPKIIKKKYYMDVI